MSESSENTVAGSHAVTTSSRLASVDALRGFVMFWIIGGQWIFGSLDKIFDCPATRFISTQLQHVKWEGFRFEDLIMPLFLFIVGVAMPFSFGKRIARGDSKKQLYYHVVKRVVILWILGMMVQGNLLKYDLSKLQLYSNTLQSIAAGYLIASIAMLHLGKVCQILLAVMLMLLFWILMTCVPVPGYGPGVLTPEGNLAVYLDKLILGPFRPPLTYTWILSSMTFGSTVMLGVMAGYLLRSERKQVTKIIGLLAAGIACLVLGLIWNDSFPIIKYLWTSSFVLYAAGWCYLLLALFYLLIDVWGLKKCAFGLVVIGMNAIAVYVSTRLFDFRLIGDIFVGGLAKWLGSCNDLVRGVAGFSVIWLILYWMYRKKTFIKI